MDLTILNKAKNKSEEIRKNVSQSTYEEGERLLDSFYNTNNINSLKEAAKIFANTIEYNKEDPRPYISLSYIFYLLENNEFALKYIVQAENLIELPEEIQQMKINIENSLNYESEEKPLSNIISSMAPPSMKVIVNQKSNFWKIFSK